MTHTVTIYWLHTPFKDVIPDLEKIDAEDIAKIYRANEKVERVEVINERPV